MSQFKDLTKDQQEHLTQLIEDHGMPPEGAVWFDMNDSSYSSFMKSDESVGIVYYWRGSGWSRGLAYDDYKHSLVFLPEPPYYLPESKALPKSDKPLVQQQAIIQCYLIETFGCSDREALAHSRLIIKEIS